MSVGGSPISEERAPGGGGPATAVVNFALAAGGIALLVAAILLGPSWAEHHFLPAWAWSWQVQLRILLVLRIAAGVAALLLLFVLRPRTVRAVAEGRGRAVLSSTFTILLAVGAALVTTEAILRTRTWTSTQEKWDQEPRRVRDPEYGWAFAPNHAGTVQLSGRTIHYATGPNGYRAPRAGAALDLRRPTIVFAGESIVFGYGLQYAETLPAQVEAMTGIQTANIAVNAHSTDQMLLRLRRELPGFARPVAVVVPFMSVLFDRNLDKDRPHLDAKLRWHSAIPPNFRMVELARRVLRYRNRESINEGVAMTQAALAAVTRLVESRGAQLIIMVPQFAPEQARERAVREAVLDRAKIPYLLVRLDSRQRDSFHGHPNPDGSRTLALAVTGALDRSKVSSSSWR